MQGFPSACSAQVCVSVQVKAIPFLTFDAGGVLELFDHEKFDEVVVRDATPDALARKLDEVLSAGRITTVQLTPAITGGQQQWLDFHAGFAQSVQQNREVLLAPGPQCLPSHPSCFLSRGPLPSKLVCAIAQFIQ